MKKDIFGDDEQTNDSQDFASMLAQSTQKLGQSLNVGDKIKAEILSIGKEETFVSTGSTHDALLMTKEITENGAAKYKVGDVLDVYITQVKGSDVRVSTTPGRKNSADEIEDAFDMELPVDGKVTEQCNGGFRVLVFGKTAFCPISQIDSKFTDDPSQYVGKKMQFIITQFDSKGRNIVVSRRKLLDQQKGESLVGFFEDKKVGDTLTGTVKRLEAYGAFVEVLPQLEGLVHISEVSWSHIQHPNEVLQLGQQVEVKIIKMEWDEKHPKLSLSIKQSSSTPWSNLGTNIEVGQVVSGKVTKCLKFGAFVEIAPGIEGLIPMNEMSYTKRVVKSDEIIKPGEQVMVMIKDINPEDRKMTLSLKDAGGDPWAMVQQKYPVGSQVEATLLRRENFGHILELESGITGLMPKSKMKNMDLDLNYEAKKVGDKFKVQVLEIQFENRKMTLGAPGEAVDESWRGFQTEQKSGSFGSFADQLKDLKLKK